MHIVEFSEGFEGKVSVYCNLFLRQYISGDNLGKDQHVLSREMCTEMSYKHIH